jgi:alkyl hydroperoxide reductase subunit F
MSPTVYDLIIIGGGPAGTAAGVYAARKRLKTLLLTNDFGGQSVVSPDIHNWIGTPSISGIDLANSFRKHLEAYAEDVLIIKDGENITLVKKEDDNFLIDCESGKKFIGRAVLIATGSARKKLPAKNADKFEHKGITYCASCDGPLYAGKDVVVIGAGNAAFESAAQLLAYTKSVTLLHRGTEFTKADPGTVAGVIKHPNMKIILNAETTEVNGGDFAESLTYRDITTNEIHEIKTDGIFVEIGQTPNTELVLGLIEMDARRHIVVNPRNQRASLDGIWAAGDVTNGLYHQNNIAAGDAVKALEDIYIWLHGKN